MDVRQRHQRVAGLALAHAGALELYGHGFEHPVRHQRIRVALRVVDLAADGFLLALRAELEGSTCIKPIRTTN